MPPEQKTMNGADRSRATKNGQVDELGTRNSAGSDVPHSRPGARGRPMTRPRQGRAARQDPAGAPSDRDQGGELGADELRRLGRNLGTRVVDRACLGVYATE